MTIAIKRNILIVQVLQAILTHSKVTFLRELVRAEKNIPARNVLMKLFIVFSLSQPMRAQM